MYVWRGRSLTHPILCEAIREGFLEEGIVKGSYSACSVARPLVTRFLDQVNGESSGSSLDLSSFPDSQLPRGDSHLYPPSSGMASKALYFCSAGD